MKTNTIKYVLIIGLLCIALTGNASYYLYADYDDIQDIGDIAVIEKRFNQYWFIMIVGLILIIGGYYLYRKVRYQ